MIRAKLFLRWAIICVVVGGCSVIAMNGAPDRAEGEESKEGCVTPAGGPVVEAGSPQTATMAAAAPRAPTARVGQKAPDFEASGYVDGAFKNVKLSSYTGKWVILCFYPGDFTFV